MKPKVGNNSKTSRLEAYEIHLYAQKGDRVKYGGCVNQGWERAQRLEAVRRSGEKARKWRRRLMRKCGETRGEDVAIMIEQW